nr:MFS.3 [Starmerella bombicola]
MSSEKKEVILSGRPVSIPDTEHSSESVTQAEIDNFGEKIDRHVPDGGVMAWLQVLGAWTAIVMTFGISSGTGVLMQWLEVNYLKNMSSSRVGWMFSVQLFIFYIMGVFLGPVVDAYGVRMFILVGSAGWVAAMFILSACKEYYQFVLCYSILGGFSSSLLFNPAVTVLTHWFDKHRGLAIGIAASGSGVGGIIFTQIFNKLLDRISFGWAVRVVAFVVLACALISCLTLRSRHVRKSINWEEAKPDLKALLEPNFLFCVLGLFFAEWAIFVPMQYIVSYAVIQGFSRSFGSNLVSYLSTASVISRICTGYLADRLGSFNLMALFAALSGILCLALWLPAGHTKGGLVTFCVLFGITSGAVISLTLITVPQLSSVKNAGRRYGTAYMISSFAVLTGIPLAGALTAHHYLGVVLFSGCVYLASSLCYFVSKCYITDWNALF